MNIFQLLADLERTLLQLAQNLGQRRFNFGRFVGGKDLLISQHLGMGNAAGDIVSKKTLVKTDAFGKPLHTFVDRGIKSTTATGT